MGLSFGRAILNFFFPRAFRHYSISSEAIACCRFSVPVVCPLLSAPVSPSLPAKLSSPRRRTPTHSPRHLPRRQLWYRRQKRLRCCSFYTCVPMCVMATFGGKLPLMVSTQSAGAIGPSKSVDPGAGPALFFVSSLISDGATCISFTGSGGAPCALSSGSGGLSCVSSGSEGAPRVSSSECDDAFCDSSSGFDGASRVFSAGPGGTSCVSCMRSRDAGCCSSSSSCTSSCGSSLFPTDLYLPGPRPHRQHRRCRYCQASQSTVRPAVSVSPVSAPRRAPTGPCFYSHHLSRFCCQRQRNPLSRVLSHTCCEKQSFAGRENKNKRLLFGNPKTALVL